MVFSNPSSYQGGSTFLHGLTAALIQSGGGATPSDTHKGFQVVQHSKPEADSPDSFLLHLFPFFLSFHSGCQYIAGCFAFLPYMILIFDQVRCHALTSKKTGFSARFSGEHLDFSPIFGGFYPPPRLSPVYRVWEKEYS
jgi:hypothetical protein